MKLKSIVQRSWLAGKLKRGRAVRRQNKEKNKTFLQQGQTPEHLDFDNPLYRDLLGLDASQNPHDLLLEQGTKPVSDLFTSEKGWIHAKYFVVLHLVNCCQHAS